MPQPRVRVPVHQRSAEPHSRPHRHPVQAKPDPGRRGPVPCGPDTRRRDPPARRGHSRQCRLAASFGPRRLDSWIVIRPWQRARCASHSPLISDHHEQQCDLEHHGSDDHVLPASQGRQPSGHEPGQGSSLPAEPSERQMPAKGGNRPSRAPAPRAVCHRSGLHVIAA